jgi:hypothetical protein
MYYSTFIKILSLNEEWEFKSITTFQQKEINKALLLNNSTSLLRLLDTVIFQCCNPERNTALLTIIDKVYILIKLRCESIGDSIEVEITKDEKKYSTAYNFNETASNFENTQLSVTKIKYNILEIDCSVPSIKNEKLIFDLLNSKDTTYDDIMPFFISHIKINDGLCSLTHADLIAVLG